MATDAQRESMREIEAIGVSHGCELSTYPANPADGGVHVSPAITPATPDGTPLPEAVREALRDAGYTQTDYGLGIWCRDTPTD